MSYTTTSLDGVIATDNIETAQQVIDAIASQGSISTGTVSVSSSVNTDKITISGDAINSIGATTNDIKITNSATGATKIDNILTLKGNTIGSLSNNDVVITPNGTGAFKTDNLQLDGNTVSATDTNGNLNLNANGSGKVIIDNDLAIDQNGLTQTANSDIYLTTTSGKVRIDSLSLDAGTVKAELGDLTLTCDDDVSNKVFIGTLPFKLNQSIGSGNNNHVLTYDNSTATISLQAASGGGSSQWTTSGSNIYYDGGNVGVGVSSSSVNSQLMVKDTSAAHTAVQVTSASGQNCSLKLSRGAGDWSSSNNETIGLHLDTNRLSVSKLTAEGNNLTGYAGSTVDIDVQNSRMGVAAYPYGGSIATTLQLGSIGSGRTESLRCSTNAGAGIADRSIEVGVDSTSSFIESNDSSNAPIELQVRQGSNGNVFVVDTDGDVGIGNTTPAAKLSVACSSGKRALLITGDPGSSQSQVYLSGATYGIAMGMNNSSASNYALSLNNSSTNIFYVQNNGQIGIGNNSPTVGKLNVTGFFGGSVPSGYYTTHSSGANIVTQSYSGSSFAYSLYCSNAIGANGIGWTSDERIKTEIAVVDDAWALQKVRDIECKEYHYKDPLLRKEHKTIGYIAQDVQQHLPQAVSQITDYVPDELRPIENITWVPVDDGFKVVIPNVIWKEEHTRMMKFYVTTTENEEEIKLELKADDNNAVIFEKQYATVYLYGKEVNNFLQIAKDKIYSLHHSAIQEIDRIQVAHKSKISTLEARMALLEQRLNNAGL
jgi:hypothetical protein